MRVFSLFLVMAFCNSVKAQCRPGQALQTFALQQCNSILIVGTGSWPGLGTSYVLQFTEVDAFDASAGTPTLTQLQKYDAVLVYSNESFYDPVGLGNVLADYWDGGGGVVLTAFADGVVQGRFGDAQNGYILIDSRGGGYGSSGSLGTIYEPQSPLLAGVGSISEAEFNRMGSVINNGVVVATWSGDISPLVVRGTRNGRNIVELNMFPMSEASFSSGWTGDEAVLIQNSLQYSITTNQCVNCTAGSYSSLQSATACNLCWVGSHSPAASATSPSSCHCCASGSYSSAEGQSACTLCAPGTYLGEILSVASSCSNCASGSYSTALGASSSAVCENCTLGSYSGKGQSTCTFCVAGTLASSTGATSCTSCAAGSYSSAQGAYAECTNCSSSTYSSSQGQSTCALCVGGTFSSVTGGMSSAECMCPPGSYLFHLSPQAVLVVGTGGAGSPQNVQFDLQQTGAFAIVDAFDASSSTPTLTQLENYGAVLVYCWTGFYDAVGLGDVLADYWDVGGGVVLTAFANDGQTPLLGRFGDAQNGYILIGSAGSEQGPSGSLGTIYEPQSPLLAGVSSLSADYLWNSLGPVINNGVVVATWSGDNRPLVVRGTRDGRDIVELNMYPVSQAGKWVGWTGDGAVLLKNALQYSTTQQKCIDCPAGSYSSSQGETSSASCTACVPGTYSSGQGASSPTTCKNCSSDTYAAAQGQSACTLCAAGSFSPAIGATSCICLAGSYMSQCSSVLILATILLEDVQFALQQTGAFAKVDAFDASTGTPTLTQLQKYDAVLVFSYYNFYDPVGLGNVLADYWDGGGGVVLTAFADGVQGRFGDAQNGYILIDIVSGEDYSSGSLGTIYEPQSQLLDGFSSLAEVALYSTGSVINNGLVVATWNDNTPLIVQGTRNGRNIVEVNLYPYYDSWYGDESILMKNALQYSIPKCSSCAAGAYSSSQDAASCSSCIAGSYAVGEGLSSCTLCRAGTFASAQSATSPADCANCSLGSYASFEGHSVCNFCSLGEFSASEGATVCRPCPPGSYMPEKWTACALCWIGTYSSVQGATSPSVCSCCAPGSFTSDEGHTACTFCAVGAYLVYNENSSATCTSCSSGSYSSVQGAASSSDCRNCTAGSYTSSQGLSACTLCAAGAFSTQGSALCLSCPAGFYSSSPGASSCISYSVSSATVVAAKSVAVNYGTTSPVWSPTYAPLKSTYGGSASATTHPASATMSSARGGASSTSLSQITSSPKSPQSTTSTPKSAHTTTSHA